jgi:ABC-type Fe3+ transport system substrate-binding protein
MPRPDRLTVYCARRNPTPAPLFKLFGQLHEVEVAAEVASFGPAHDRLRGEREAPRCDVAITKTRPDMELLAAEGLLEPHQPPLPGLPGWLHHPDFAWTGFSGWPRCAIVNRVVLPDPAQWPTGLESFCEPRFRGHFACASTLERTTRAHFAAIAAVKGLDATRDLLDRLMANGMIVRSGNTALREEMMSAPFAAALASDSNVHVFRLQGNAVARAPLDQEPGGIGTHVEAHTVAVVRGAPRPDLARAFVDFLFSEAAQGLLAQLHGETPVNPAAAHFDVVPLAQIRRIDAPLAEIERLMAETVRLIDGKGLANPAAA